MAKRSTRGAKKRPARAATPRDRVLDAVLAVAARDGWQRASLAAIAAEAGLKLHEVYDQFRSRGAMLAGLIARVDAASLTGADDEAREAPRDRLFAILMRRFDALKPHRAAVRAIACGTLANPPMALCGAPALLRSMSWMLEAAGVSAGGLRGRLRVKALTLLYLGVLRVFLGDESADLAKTMAALDRRLSQAAPFLGLAEFTWGRGRAKEQGVQPAGT